MCAPQSLDRLPFQWQWWGDYMNHDTPFYILVQVIVLMRVDWAAEVRKAHTTNYHWGLTMAVRKLLASTTPDFTVEDCAC